MSISVKNVVTFLVLSSSYFCSLQTQFHSLTEMFFLLLKIWTRAGSIQWWCQRPLTVRGSVTVLLVSSLTRLELTNKGNMLLLVCSEAVESNLLIPPPTVSVLWWRHLKWPCMCNLASELPVKYNLTGHLKHNFGPCNHYQAFDTLNLIL